MRAAIMIAVTVENYREPTSEDGDRVDLDFLAGNIARAVRRTLAEHFLDQDGEPLRSGSMQTRVKDGDNRAARNVKIAVDLG